jgi:hypothetical protein
MRSQLPLLDHVSDSAGQHVDRHGSIVLIDAGHVIPNMERRS